MKLSPCSVSARGVVRGVELVHEVVLERVPVAAGDDLGLIPEVVQGVGRVGPRGIDRGIAAFVLGSIRTTVVTAISTASRWTRVRRGHVEPATWLSQASPHSDHTAAGLVDKYGADPAVGGQVPCANRFERLF